MYDRKVFGKKVRHWHLKINGDKEEGIQPSWHPKNLDDILTMMHSVDNHYGADVFEKIITKLGGITPRLQDVGTSKQIEQILKGEYDWSSALNKKSSQAEWKKIYSSQKIQVASRAAEIYRVIASGELHPAAEDGGFTTKQIIGILTAGGNMNAAQKLRATLES